VFVRFVVGDEAENPYWLTGVLTIARILQDEGKLYKYESEWLEEIYDWFNKHLPCPPFEQKRRAGEWTEDAVSWFRDDAKEPMKRIWDLVALLRQHDESVRMVTTDDPGKIVYSDEFQVVAESRRWAK
jgi:hypothetical protein